jgi:hypothetical protein
LGADADIRADIAVTVVFMLTRVGNIAPPTKY